MYTSHGHHIPFTTLARDAPDEVKPCGGVRVCIQCTYEAANYAPALKRVAEPPYHRRGGDMDFLTRAKELVYLHVKDHLEKTDTHVTFARDEVYIVWFSKTLQNWKALLSTTLPDGMYYEVTHNGDEKVTYLDAYKKFMNVAIPDEPEL